MPRLFLHALLFVAHCFAASAETASWIAAGDTSAPNTWTAFRRTFALPTVPARVEARVGDSEGLLVPRSKPALTFTVEGPGEIVATDNGDATDLTTFASTERKAFNGLALVIVRAKPGVSGEFTVTATSEGMPSASTTLRSSR